MRRASQGGAALLAAMLTVSLVATFAAAAMWQQWRSVEVEAADRTRVQSEWILQGALDWARLILREDRNGADHLAEPWAVPLQEARLSTFLAADQGNNADTGESDNVFLSGQISDVQAKLNLGILVRAGVDQPAPLAAFRRLFDILQLPQQELTRMAENLRFASDISLENRNAARASLPPMRLEQLAWLGLSPESVAALQPHVIILPPGNSSVTTVNLNTASPEVLYAVIPGIGLADAQRLVAERERQFFKAPSDVLALLPADTKLEQSLISVDSHYFEVRGRLRLEDVVIEERSIVSRFGLDVKTLQRERGPGETPTTAPTTR
jgi:general secretion pathway protein K